MKDFEFMQIDDRKIIIRGLGRMFYQEGMPIGIMAKQAMSKGMEVSWFHVVDELLKHGWSEKTIRNKLSEELQDSGTPELIDKVDLFLSNGYEGRRELIFNYLFQSNPEKATEWFKQNVFR